MHKLTRDDLEQAARHIYQVMPATAQYPWPLLAERLGCTVWVKHENHTPTGAFKVRGGITFLHWLRREHPSVKGIVSATRGNHGQSLALAASTLGLRALIVVPEGNSLEKNNAMRVYYTDTHNLAEGAGAAALAALIQEREMMLGKKVAVILSGGNIDRGVYANVIG